MLWCDTQRTLGEDPIPSPPEVWLSGLRHWSAKSTNIQDIVSWVRILFPPNRARLPSQVIQSYGFLPHMVFYSILRGVWAFGKHKKDALATSFSRSVRLARIVTCWLAMGRKPTFLKLRRHVKAKSRDVVPLGQQGFGRNPTREQERRTSEMKIRRYGAINPLVTFALSRGFPLIGRAPVPF